MSDNKYELVVLDADTPVLRAALSVQKNYVMVTRKEDAKSVRYDNITQFWGHWKNKAGGQLAQVNEVRAKKGLEPFTPDDFTVEECAELNPEIMDHLGTAIEQFDYFVGKIKRMEIAEDYLLLIGGSGNYRHDLAQKLQYKGARKDKPLLFAEAKEAIIEKYKNRVVICNNQEADDVAAIMGAENYRHFLRTGEWKYILGFIDKDLEQIISPQFNYGKDSPEMFIPGPLDAAKAFCVQMLSGDLSTDNISGLPNFTDEIREKYSLGKTRGIGKATALKYLEGCENIKELFSRVVEAYRSYYGEDKQELVSWRGDKLEWNWLDHLQENAQLLYLRRSEGEMYNIRTTLDRLEIDYD